MAAASLLGLLLPPSLQSPSLSFPGSCRQRRFLFPKASVASAGAGGPAVVWFKNDLRLDDHPGLADAAEKHPMVVPVYVFDPRILSGFSDEMLQLLLFALEDLRKLLKDQGSDLFIRYGSTEDAILKLVNEVKATHIFLEEEVEYNLRRLTGTVESSLSARTFSWGGLEIVFWSTPFYDVKMEELPAAYDDFQKLQIPLANPISAPLLPSLTMEDTGTLPTFDDLKEYLNRNGCQADESWISLKEISPKSILRKDPRYKIARMSDPINGFKTYEGKSTEILRSNNPQRAKMTHSVFASPEGNQVRGGTDNVLNALAAYLRYLEGTARDDWQELHEKLRLAEKRRGSSFGALFGSSLYLGTISRRRVYYEAIKYEKERNAGFISPFGYSAATVAAAVNTVCSMEWYWLLALKSQRCSDGIYPIRIWRWKGHLIQYTVVGNEGPAILFVHGFGAFLEHFRGNMSSMADGGHRVWGITLLGFGRSEKPNIVYTELMWTELLRDFIVDVVGEPVHLVGNSIGGYFVAAVAGLWHALAKSVVLINTAGSVVSNYPSTVLIEDGQTSGIAWLGSRLLLLYLRLRAGDILKSCYPTNTERIDDWLVSEIIRASYDPGVPIVLECVFNFKLQVPLNYFLDSLKGKVLVLQGMKDPLSKAEKRLSMFRENCSWIPIKEVDAGHCPHDELPKEVNLILSDWIKTAESSLVAV